MIDSKGLTIDRTQRRVVCAALATGGFIVLGPRHFDQTMQGQLSQANVPVLPCEQGFIDQWGKFMNRKEAFEVATAAGQILQKTGNPDSKELFSEDIY